MWEQLEIAAQYQHYWADNSVSVTVTFKPEEASQIKNALDWCNNNNICLGMHYPRENDSEESPFVVFTKLITLSIHKIGLKPRNQNYALYLNISCRGFPIPPGWSLF